MNPQSLADLLVSSQEQCDHDGVMVKVSRQALDETVAYLRQAAAEVRGGVPDGFVAVPREPTPAMLDHAVSLMLNVSISGEGGWTRYAEKVWRTMIAAGPAPGGQ